jgi:signal transduction histidine kinase
LSEQGRSPEPAAWIRLTGRYRHLLGRLGDVGLALLILLTADPYGVGYDWPLSALMALTMFVRRRWPAAVLAAVLALCTAQGLLSGGDSPLASAPAAYDIAVLCAMMSVVHHSRDPRMPYLAGGAVLLATGAAAVVVPPGGLDPVLFPEDLPYFWGGTLTVWLTAYSLRTRRLYAESQAARAWHAEREQENRMRLAAAEERAGIARELHDVVAHSLAVMILQADGAGAVLRKAPDMAESALKTIAATGRDAIDDMHRIVRVLREGDQGRDADGTERRLVTLDEIEVVAERARVAGLTVDVTVEVGEGLLTPAEEMTAFRIVQECLTNVLRHAGAGAKVGIELREEQGTLLIGVTDDGAGTLAGGGIDPHSGGNGLMGMRERVELAGGTFEAGPRLGSGWHVRARIPTRTRR